MSRIRTAIGSALVAIFAAFALLPAPASASEETCIGSPNILDDVKYCVCVVVLGIVEDATGRDWQCSAGS